MANISVGLGTAAGLPQGTVVQAEGVNVDPKQEAQAAPIGDLEHHNEQVHLLLALSAEHVVGHGPCLAVMILGWGAGFCSHHGN